MAEQCFWKYRQMPFNIASGQKKNAEIALLAPFLSKCIFAFYVETQDDHQNW